MTARDTAAGHDVPLVVLHRPLEPPAPLLIANGWTDDLFPADEALRFYNRTTTQYPRTPVSLFFLDFGHPRGQNKDADEARYVAAINRWLDFYLKGVGRKPFQGVQALTETCPASRPSGGPFRASSWARLAPGEVRVTSPVAQTILADGGSAAIGATFNPIGAAACANAPGAPQPGTATYAIRGRTGGFTMIGAPTVIADFTLPRADSQVAARLLDVGPTGGRRWWAVGSGGRRSRASRCARCSSSTQVPGGSRRATRSSSSCCPRTRRTAGPPTTRRR